MSAISQMRVPTEQTVAPDSIMSSTMKEHAARKKVLDARAADNPIAQRTSSTELLGG